MPSEHAEHFAEGGWDGYDGRGKVQRQAIKPPGLQKASCAEGSIQLQLPRMALERAQDFADGGYDRHGGREEVQRQALLALESSVATGHQQAAWSCFLSENGLMANECRVAQALRHCPKSLHSRLEEGCSIRGVRIKR